MKHSLKQDDEGLAGQAGGGGVGATLFSDRVWWQTGWQGLEVGTSFGEAGGNKREPDWVGTGATPHLPGSKDREGGWGQFFFLFFLFK